MEDSCVTSAHRKVKGKGGPTRECNQVGGRGGKTNKDRLDVVCGRTHMVAGLPAFFGIGRFPKLADRARDEKWREFRRFLRNYLTGSAF